MLKKIGLAVVAALVFVAGIAVGQLSFPNEETPVIVLENDHVVVQKADSHSGDWVGTHKHAGNQLAVALDDLTLMYKVGGEEKETAYKAGDVFWIDAVEHDHKALTKGSVVIVTLK